MKILIISHTCISSYNNLGKTFLSLFSGFKKEELCQLYIYPSLPDVDVCNSYYRVTDKDIRRSLFSLKPPGGVLPKEKVCNGKTAAYEDSKDAALYSRKSNSSAVVRLLRDAMWKVSHWYTRELRRWVEKEKPTCIFLAPAYAKFVYDIALTISKDYAIPIVTYICDDYYFVRKPNSAIEKIQYRLLCKKIEQLMKKTDSIVAICEEIKENYTQKFGVPATVVMTGTTIQALRNTESDTLRVISYFGNLVYNRYISLAQVGHTLEQINRTHGRDYCLKIYTNQADRHMHEYFSGIQSVEMCDFVTGKMFEKAMQQSDFLLHVEAFDEISVDTVKHSVSTKIADSLASGIPLIAYAPAEVSSMRHLTRNQCAMTASTQQELYDVLCRAFSDQELRNTVVRNAQRVAAIYHSNQENVNKLRKILDIKE